MEHFYDGQIRRYVTQTIRALSNFVVKYGDGTLVRIPVMYGDADRQVASIIRNNSENKVNSVPRISVYITGLAMDRDRLSDQTFVGTINIRERDIDPDTNRYTTGQGRNYTIERLMPTPFKLTMKCDIWSANTDQKLQILEQILVLFNPSLELQTTDNYVDWTSLTVLNLNDISWDSRTVPVGTDTPIDIATLTLDTPIWINPPVKVKHLGVITKIVTSMYNTSTTSGTYIDGLGQDPIGTTTSMADLLGLVIGSDENYRLEVYNGQAILIGAHESVVERGSSLEMPVRLGTPINWNELFARTPNKYKAGSSQLYLTQPNGSLIVGTFAVNSLDETILQVKWDVDTLTTNTGIDSAGVLDSDSGYNLQSSYRPNSPGTFDAIIDPQQYDPKKPNKEAVDQPVAAGRRFLIIEDIGSTLNAAGKGPTAWQSTTGVDFVAQANDIIEWTGLRWTVIFNSSQNPDTMVWQTNIYTGIQYLWNGVSWVKSFEGVYEAANWKIVL
jgi:hypothetical protein